MPCALVLTAALVAAAPEAPSAGPAALPSRYMALRDIRPGMKGIGKTVLKGTEIVDFQVEVLGILRNVTPKSDLILVRCAGQGLEESGVIMGMSGSPIYIDGRLVGALAYAWRFSKSPLAGITPIEEMLAVAAGREGKTTAPASRVAGTARRPPFDQGPSEPASAESAPGAGVHTLLPPITVAGRTYGRLRVLREFPATPDAGDGMPTLSPIATPVMVPRTSKETADRLRPLLARAGWVPVQATGLADAGAPGLTARIEPGAVCAVSLVTGDLNMTAIGTITDRVGDQVWAFGHPFFGMGEVEMPLSTGAVLAVLPSQMASFKFGAPLEPAGTITADEAPGIKGTLARRAPTVPLAVTTHVQPRPPAAYRFDLLRHKFITAALLRSVVYESIHAAGKLPDECTVGFEAALDFAGGRTVRMANTYAGPGGAAELVQRLFYVSAELLDNDIQPIALDRATVSVTVEPGLRSAEIESVRLDTPRLKPGETVVVRVVLKPFRREREVVVIKLPLPREIPEGTYTVVLANAAGAGRLDLSATPHRLEPRTIDDLVALAREDRDNRKLYARLELPDGGVAVEGRELPRLPAFALSVFGATRWSGTVSPVRRLIGSEVDTNWVIQGGQSVSVTVTEKP